MWPTGAEGACAFGMLHEIIDLPGHDAVSTHQGLRVVVGVHIATMPLEKVSSMWSLQAVITSDTRTMRGLMTVIFQMEKRTPEDTFGKPEPTE